ncbi:hypothetical protein CP532_2592 [Ophiocordyceps camponoti-leonardi (nom. inval.)]|nr:hypothetical protein CP532_2592 [Ophiocordyceps camponoti-leonardi (nom. inval.)]
MDAVGGGGGGGGGGGEEDQERRPRGGGSVRRRKAEDEGTDSAAILTRLEQGSWREWPNRAGFENLQEHRGPIRLRTRGLIPPWTAGSLYRTGPGQSSVEGTRLGTHTVAHWFDGFAHTHRFDIVVGHDRGDEDDPGGLDHGTTNKEDEDIVSVLYSSRRQSDEHVDHIRRVGWRSSTSFGQRADPCVGIFAKFMSFFEPRRINNNVVCLPNFPGLISPPPPSPSPSPSSTPPPPPTNDDDDNRLNHRPRTGIASMHISTDHNALQEIHPDSLEPVGVAHQKQLHPDLSGPMSCAHAQRDPHTGDWYNYNLSFGRCATYRVFRVNAKDGSTEILATVSAPDIPAAYLHSFFLTDHHVVLCIPGAHFAWNGVRILWERNIMDAIKPFDPSRPCQWLVVDRRHGKGLVARFTTPAAFFFHSVNGYEEQVKGEATTTTTTTQLILDLVLYDNTEILFGLYYDVLLNRRDAMADFIRQRRHLSTRHRLVRYRYRMGVGDTSAEEVLSIPSPHSGELSTINPHRAGRPYRYVYSISSRGLSTFMDAIVKTDLETREALIWTGPWGHTPGEPVFVPRPGRDGSSSSTDEDDGVVLSVVLDGEACTSYLLCLDARSMREMGRAEAEFAIAVGFHGCHAPTLA